jgi:DNA repair protein RadA/Sms
MAAMDLGLNETSFASVGTIDVDDMDLSRFNIGIPCLDNLMGRGLMPSMVITITSVAGCGKTTLLLQLLESIATKSNKKVGYISAEEDVSQLAYNAVRIGVTNVQVANMCNIDKICDTVFPKFDVVVLDSFQCMKSNLVKGKNKVQEYAIHKIVKAAKETRCVVFNICHLTKDGKLKGDSGVIHAVDCTMQIYKGDPETYGHDEARLIEVSKNRFGKTGEITLRMGGKGYDFANPIKA